MLQCRSVPCLLESAVEVKILLLVLVSIGVLDFSGTIDVLPQLDTIIKWIGV